MFVIYTYDAICASNTTNEPGLDTFTPVIAAQMGIYAGGTPMQ